MIVCGICYVECKAHAPYFIYNCGLSPSAVSSTLFEISGDFEYIEWNMECVSWFLTKCSRNFTDFKKNKGNIKTNSFKPLIKHSTSLSNRKQS